MNCKKHSNLKWKTLEIILENLEYTDPRKDKMKKQETQNHYKRSLNTYSQQKYCLLWFSSGAPVSHREKHASGEPVKSAVAILSLYRNRAQQQTAAGREEKMKCLIH